MDARKPSPLPAPGRGRGRGQMSITYDDYARAESFLPWNAAKLAFKLNVEPNWLDEPGGDDRFWYRNQTRDGSEFVLVDPAAGSRAPAFDHVWLAASLS